MRRYWDKLFSLDEERSIWIEEEDLGKEKKLSHKNKHYFVRIPEKINEKVTLRLKGLGRKKDNQTGDLLLHIWLNLGKDIRKSLWLSESSAKYGAYKTLLLDEKKIQVFVPSKSFHGLVIHLKGLGGKPVFRWQAPFLRRKRGDLLVRLCVYPDVITPAYGSFDTLNTDDMALEGWVYRKIDEMLQKIGEAAFPIHPMQADTVADLFNERGCSGICEALVGHLKLTDLTIRITASDSISIPGNCQKTVTYHNLTPVASRYTITINQQFLDNPFAVAAIMAHELSHVIYSEKIGENLTATASRMNKEKITLEEERTVDLLVFMFKVGEFQLRVARDQRLTLGYFNQSIFERIQVIVLKKSNSP
jgi:hypothetical protein